MALRKLTPIPNATGSELIPLDKIPAEVKDNVTEILKVAQEQDARTRLEFDTPDELKTWFKQAASYCAHSHLKIRRSPTRDLPDNVMDVRVARDVPGQAAAKDPKKK